MIDIRLLFSYWLPQFDLVPFGVKDMDKFTVVVGFKSVDDGHAVFFKLNVAVPIVSIPLILN